MMKIKLILENLDKNGEISKQSIREKKVNLISNLYYETDWWQKNIALEWWQKNGHFNDKLYQDILSVRLENIN